MSHIPVAIQLYSVRDLMEKDVPQTLKDMAAIGYAGVEFAGYFGHSAADLRKLLDDLGLKAEGTHTMLEAFSHDKLAKTIEDHQTLGAPYAIIPWLPEERRSTYEACISIAAELTEVAVSLRGSGIQTGFHAHEGDMRPIETPAGPQSAWSIIAENTPEDFVMQYDTGNGVSGGADPVAPITDFPGRSGSVHLKEHNPPGVPAITNTGAVPWLEVFKACESVGGTKWYVVEAEVYGDLTSLEVVTKCFENLKALGKV